MAVGQRPHSYCDGYTAGWAFRSIVFGSASKCFTVWKYISQYSFAKKQQLGHGEGTSRGQAQDKPRTSISSPGQAQDKPRTSLEASGALRQSLRQRLRCPLALAIWPNLAITAPKPSRRPAPACKGLTLTLTLAPNQTLTLTKSPYARSTLKP